MAVGKLEQAAPRSSWRARRRAEPAATISAAKNTPNTPVTASKEPPRRPDRPGSGKSRRAGAAAHVEHRHTRLQRQPRHRLGAKPVPKTQRRQVGVISRRPLRARRQLSMLGHESHRRRSQPHPHGAATARGYRATTGRPPGSGRRVTFRDQTAHALGAPIRLCAPCQGNLQAGRAGVGGSGIWWRISGSERHRVPGLAAVAGEPELTGEVLLVAVGTGRAVHDDSVGERGES